MKNMHIKNRFKVQNHQHSSKSSQSLPDQWQSLASRISFLQSNVIKMQKKTTKIQKMFLHENQQNKKFQHKIQNEIQILMHSSQMKEIQIEENNKFRKDIDEIRSSIENIQTNNNQSNRFNHSFIYYGKKQIENFINKRIQLNKDYIDNAIESFRNILTNYFKQYENLSQKIHSPNKQIIQLNEGRKTPIKNTTSSINLLSPKSQVNNYHKNNNKKQELDNFQTTNLKKNRVNFLKDKLKQFENINKKYTNEYNGIKKKKEKKNQTSFNTINKMKEFKNYLEQSQSQIQPSYLSSINLHKPRLNKWKSLEKKQSLKQ